MPPKIIISLLTVGLLCSCLHSPSYYASLKTETYAHGEAKFSNMNLNSNVKYGSLSLREDGACSISEIRDGVSYHGGGAWSRTDHKKIVSVGLSSNSAMTAYHFFVFLNDKNNSYIVSDKLEELVEK
jgi:hypothetical protein